MNGRPSKEDSDLVAGSFLAFAAMMLKDYGVGREYALKALAVAYEMTEPPTPCTCSNERDKALCKRKAECVEVDTFVRSVDKTGA